MRPTLFVLPNVVAAALSRPASSGDARAGRDCNNPLRHYERGAVMPAQAWAGAERIWGTLVVDGG